MQPKGMQKSYLLATIDPKSFQQTKRSPDSDPRSLGDRKNSSRNWQVSSTITLQQDSLISLIEVQLSHQGNYNHLLTLLEPQSDTIVGRGKFTQMLGPAGKIGTPQTNSEIFSLQRTAFAQNVRIRFLLRKDFQVSLPDLTWSKGKMDENIGKAISNCIKTIRLYGFLNARIPSQNHLTNLLNLTDLLNSANRLDEAAEASILVALSLMGARKFIQASELLKNTSAFYVKKYISHRSANEFSRLEKSFLSQNCDEVSAVYRSAGRALEGGKFLGKAAKVELFLAETINHPSLLHTKLEGYHRASCYYSGCATPTLLPLHIDPEDCLLSDSPTLFPLMIKLLSDKHEPFKTSALKSIEFVIETLGSAAAEYIRPVLKTLITTYPCSQVHDSDEIQTKMKCQADQYHHLLATVLSSIGSMSPCHQHKVFSEVILPSACAPYVPSELQLYLLRFSQRILSVCGADLAVTPSFIEQILQLSQPRSQFNVDNSPTVIFHASKVIEAFKSKFIPYADGPILKELCDWICSTLMDLCQSQIGPTTLYLYSQLLQFCLTIYARKIRAQMQYPFQPLLYFLNLSIHHQHLPFEKTLQCVSLLLRGADPECQGLLMDLVDRIMARSQVTALTSKQLKVLHKAIEACSQIPIEWIQQFLDCVPHSILDETYAVFDCLMDKGFCLIDQKLMSRIIRALTDQYTVKGKAHQHSKDAFIGKAVAKSSQYLSMLLNACLLDNKEPKMGDYGSRMHPSNIDTKMYRIDYELFVEKLSLAVMLLRKLEEEKEEKKTCDRKHSICLPIIEEVRCLCGSMSAKIRATALTIMKSVIIIMMDKHYVDDIETITISCVDILTKIMCQKERDSKIQLSALFNVNLIVNRLLFKPSHQSIDIRASDPIQQASDKMSKEATSILFQIILKLLPCLSLLCQSAWAQVQQLCCYILLEVFKNGLQCWPQGLHSDVVTGCQTIIQTLATSTCSSHRSVAARLLLLLTGLNRDDIMEEEIIKVRYVLVRFNPTTIRLRKDYDEWICLTCELVAFTIMKTPFTSNASIISILASKGDESLMATLVNYQEETFLTFNQLKSLARTLLNKPSRDNPPQSLNYPSARNSPILEPNPNFYQHTEDRPQSASYKDTKSQSEQLDFQDLGIVDVGDQQCDDADDHIDQRLQVKKVARMSPNISLKHQRLRNKTYYPVEFDEPQKIIVDEVDGKIGRVDVSETDQPSPLKKEGKKTPTIKKRKSSAKK